MKSVPVLAAAFHAATTPLSAAARTTSDASAPTHDAGATADTWRIDMGGRSGLNQYTPDAQADLGLSARF